MVLVLNIVIMMVMVIMPKYLRHHAQVPIVALLVMTVAIQVLVHIQVKLVTLRLQILAGVGTMIVAAVVKHHQLPVIIPQG